VSIEQDHQFNRGQLEYALESRAFWLIRAEACIPNEAGFAAFCITA
jgi:hypothetical protein